jgi:hypothetical protein
VIEKMASAGLVNQSGGALVLSYTHPIRRCRLRCVGEACCFPLLGEMARRILECELGDAAVRLLLAANTGAKTASSRRLGWAEMNVDISITPSARTAKTTRP